MATCCARAISVWWARTWALAFSAMRESLSLSTSALRMLSEQAAGLDAVVDAMLAFDQRLVSVERRIVDQRHGAERGRFVVAVAVPA